MERPLLSVLVCTIGSRKQQFNFLDKKIREQLTTEVEYLVNFDYGKYSIGYKREELKLQSTGRYIVYIDDDDHISRNYIKNILYVVKKDNPDAISIKCLYTVNFNNKSYFIATNKVPAKQDKNISYRPIGHLNPVRREISLKAPFPDLYYGEDRGYSEGIKSFIKKEAQAPGTLYWYDYRPNQSESIQKDIAQKSIGLKLIENDLL